MKCYKTLNWLSLEQREEAYLWIVYKTNIPTAGLLLPEPGNEHHFPKFMYDKLGAKPMKRVVVMYSPIGDLSIYLSGIVSTLGLQQFDPGLSPLQLGLFTPMPLMRVLMQTVK